MQQESGIIKTGGRETAYSIEVFIGAEAGQYIDIISQLRVEMFKEYPYLYHGEREYGRV